MVPAKGQFGGTKGADTCARSEAALRGQTSRPISRGDWSAAGPLPQGRNG